MHGQSEATRSEIQGLWESGNHQELENRLRYLSIDHPFIIGDDIVFKGRESSLGPQVRFILDLSACVVADNE